MIRKKKKSVPLDRKPTEGSARQERLAAAKAGRSILDATPETREKTIATIRGLGMIWCTQTEVAAVLGVSTTTLSYFFANNPDVKQIFFDAHESGKASLRRMQFDLAKRNPNMAIHLGINKLDQKNRHSEISGPGGGGIPMDLNMKNLSSSQLMLLVDRLAKQMAGGDAKLIQHEPQEKDETDGTND